MVRSKGFTTIELMIVLAIMAILAALGTSYFRGERVKLKSAARDIVSHMQFARIKALEQGRPWAIQFNLNDRSYRVGTLSPGADGILYNEDDVVQPFKNVPLSEYRSIIYGCGLGGRPGDNVEDGVTFKWDRVFFRPDGRSAIGTVYIRGRENTAMAVGTVAATGMIRTWQNLGSGWEG